MVKQIWVSYAKIFENRLNIKAGSSSEQQKVQLFEARLEQRSAITLLRIIGSSRPEILVDYKDNIIAASLKFANFENPDFVIMLEATRSIEKIIAYQMRKTSKVG